MPSPSENRTQRVAVIGGGPAGLMAAEALAVAHRIDARRARIAGLLHDLARLYPGERLLRESAERRLIAAE